MPEIGETKTFQNGNVGRWDGTGWELISGPGQSSSPSAPPQAAEPQGPSLTQRAVTNLGLPMAGYTAGGAIAGKPGAIVGGTAGTAIGDVINDVTSPGAGSNFLEMLKHPIDTVQHLGDPEAVDAMKSEAYKLGGVTALGAAGAYGLPQLEKVPGGPQLVRAGTGYLLGGFFGHPNIGAAAGLVGYPVLNKLFGLVGKGANELVTPRIPAQNAFGMPVGEPPLSAADEADLAAQGFKGPVVDRIKANIRAQNTKPLFGDSGPIRGSVSLNPNSGIPPQPAGPPPRVSREVPYQAPSQMGGAIRLRPDQASLDALENFPQNPPPRIGRTEFPDLSNTPSMRYNADVDVAGDWKPDNLSQQGPPESDWQTLKQLFNPRRASPKGYNYSVEEEPSETPFGQRSLGAAEAKKPLQIKSKHGGGFTPTEFPPGTNQHTPPDEFERAQADYYDAQGNPDEVAAIRAKIAALLDQAKPKRR